MSEIRKLARLASSPCSPARPSGLRVAHPCSRPSGLNWPEAPAVGNAPGAIATRRTPLGPHSTARLLVIANTADLAIADGTVKARPVMVEVERMLSTTPLWPASIQRLPAPSVQYIAPCSVGARI